MLFQKLNTMKGKNISMRFWFLVFSIESNNLNEYQYRTQINI